MKNIHVLPTDKEPVKGDLLLRHIWKDTSNECISWWRYDDTITIDGVVQYTTLNGSFRDITSSFKVQNIYITSDEEIKEDYVIAYRVVIKVMMFDKETLYFVNGTKAKREDCKKIILTTDQDLIKDGVHPIDDEFLEWFVKNSSCEFVEVKNGIKRLNSDGEEIGFPDMSSYKIIIPKEEPKQETLEEAAKKFYEDNIDQSNIPREHYEFEIQDLMIGFAYEWQVKKMYSEEDMKKAFYQGS